MTSNASNFLKLHNLRKHLLATDREEKLESKKFVNAFRLLKKIKKADISLTKHGFTTRDEKQNMIVFDGLTSKAKVVFAPVTKSLGTGGAETGGASRGMKTDKQIENLINYGKLPDDGCFNMFTANALASLTQLSLIPFYAQVPVADPDLGIATALDILCVDLRVKVDTSDPWQTPNIVNVQLKTCGDKNYDTSMGYMRSPFVQNSPIKNIELSYKNMNFMQVLIEYMIVQRNYDNPLCNAAILRITDTVNEYLLLPAEFFRVQKDVYTNLMCRREKPEWVLTAEAQRDIEEHKTRVKQERITLQENRGALLHKAAPIGLSGRIKT